MYGLTLQSVPAEEPVSVAELKDWLRLETSADDAKIALLIKAVRGYVERIIGRQLVTATWVLSLDNFPWPGGWEFLERPSLLPDPHTIRLPKAPLQSVTSVQYYDMADTLQTLAASTYEVDARTDPGRIMLGMGKVWPVTRLKPGAVRVTFVAGFGSASAVPEEIKAAMKMIASAWYENPEAVTTGTIATELPRGAGDLLDAFWNGELEYGLP